MESRGDEYKKNLGKGDDVTRRHVERHRAKQRERRTTLIESYRGFESAKDGTKFTTALANYQRGQGDPAELWYQMSLYGTDAELQGIINMDAILTLARLQRTDTLCNLVNARTSHRHAIVDTLVRCNGITNWALAAAVAAVSNAACNDVLERTTLVSSGALLQALQEVQPHAYVFVCAWFEQLRAAPATPVVAAIVPHLVQHLDSQAVAFYCIAALNGLSYHISLAPHVVPLTLCNRLPALEGDHLKRAMHLVVHLVVEGTGEHNDAVRDTLMPHLGRWLVSGNRMREECCHLIEHLIRSHPRHMRAFFPLLPLLCQIQAHYTIINVCAAAFMADDSYTVQACFQRFNVVGSCSMYIQNYQSDEPKRVLAAIQVLLHLHNLAPGELRQQLRAQGGTSLYTCLCNLAQESGHAQVSTAADRLITALQ